jgi:hypothetical protein
LLSDAIVAIQAGDLTTAVEKVEDVIRRTDGCSLRGMIDNRGKDRDWITDCGPQTEVYNFLITALDALTAP